MRQKSPRRLSLGQSELPHQPNFIKSSPTLDNLVASDSEHLYALKDYHFAGGRYAHQVAAVSTARGEALNNLSLIHI